MLFRAQVSRDSFVGLVMRRETVRPNEKQRSIRKEIGFIL